MTDKRYMDRKQWKRESADNVGWMRAILEGGDYEADMSFLELFPNSNEGLIEFRRFLRHLADKEWI